MRFEIDNKAIQARATELGMNLLAAAFHSGISQDTMRKAFYKPGVILSGRTVFGISKGLKMAVEKFATRA